MTNAQIIRLLLELLAIALASYCVYRQEDIAKWERKMWRYIKFFFKALFYTVRDKLTVNTPSAEIVEFSIKK